MSKDNLVFGLAGVVLGIILGVILANYSAGSRQVAFSQPPAATQNAPAESTANAPASNQDLPEGHPPVSDETLKKQIAAQEEVLKKDPNNQDALVSLGNLNFDLASATKDPKSYQAASAYYQKALVKDPKNPDLLTDLGSCFLWLNDSQKAIDYYNKSLAIDPKHFQTLLNIGIARMSMGDRSGAADAWEKLVTLYPDNPQTPMLRDAIKRLRSKQGGTS
jgi:tetratricopeptide (TPR) repeat protein